MRQERDKLREKNQSQQCNHGPPACICIIRWFYNLSDSKIGLRLLPHHRLEDTGGRRFEQIRKGPKWVCIAGWLVEGEVRIGIPNVRARTCRDGDWNRASGRRMNLA